MIIVFTIINLINEYFLMNYRYFFLGSLYYLVITSSSRNWVLVSLLCDLTLVVVCCLYIHIYIYIYIYHTYIYIYLYICMYIYIYIYISWWTTYILKWFVLWFWFYSFLSTFFKIFVHIPVSIISILYFQDFTYTGLIWLA